MAPKHIATFDIIKLVPPPGGRPIGFCLGGLRNSWKRCYYLKFQLNRQFLYFSVEKYIFPKKNNLLKSQLLFRFSSYCHFVFCTALSMSQSIFSMLLNVPAMPSLVGTSQIMLKIWTFSRIFVKIDQSFVFKNF